MAISCAYCGGTHQRPADVRACWERSDGAESAGATDDHRAGGALPGDPTVDIPPPLADPTADIPPPTNDPGLAGPSVRPARERSDSDPDRARSHRSGSGPRRAVASPAVGLEEVPRGVAVAGAGPDALGRWAVAEPGVAVPAPWSGAEVVTIGADELRDPSATLTTLRAAAVDSTRLVIALDVDFDRAPALATDADPHRVGARFAFDLEELHHLVWLNSIDLRHSEPRWLALDRALAGGCRPVEGGSAGDVLLADGTLVWLDAGPVRHVDPIDGVPVVHHVTLEHLGTQHPDTNRSDADLAPDQLAAVTHPGGAARIIAPAGSGKTRVLTERARHLLQGWQLPASALTLVAFNKRAQEEMSERTPDLPGLHVRTLNSIGLAIVNGTPPFAPQDRRWRTIDEPDVRRIIGDLVSFPRRRNSDPVAPWIEALSLVRLGLVAPDDAEARYGGDVDGFAEMWP
ncbi:MAG: UvrD-helicase domain-containing protein, partial [Actinomycetota bacterium]